MSDEEDVRQDWWLTAQGPNGVVVWQLGNPDPDEVPDLVTRARVLLGVSPDEDMTVDDERTTRLSLSPAEPHRTLMEVATFGPPLADVSPKDVAAHADARLRAEHERAAAQLLESLKALHPEVLATMLAHPDLEAAKAAS